jgi:hypothetical protein
MRSQKRLIDESPSSLEAMDEWADERLFKPQNGGSELLQRTYVPGCIYARARERLRMNLKGAFYIDIKKLLVRPRVLRWVFCPGLYSHAYRASMPHGRSKQPSFLWIAFPFSIPVP